MSYNSNLAEQCAAYAKALHYREAEFQQCIDRSIMVSAELCESLISINTKLGMPEAAVGILTEAKKRHKIELKVFFISFIAYFIYLFFSLSRKHGMKNWEGGSKPGLTMRRS